MSGALVHYDAMCQAIEVAYRVDEVKDLRDKAMALEAYARQAKNTEAERRACEIRLRAERKAGALLKDMAKSKERATRGGSPMSQGTTLPELGVSRDQSSRWQQLADVPDDKFEQALAAEDKPSTGGILRANTDAPQTPVDPAALWLWGRLRDFERGYLEQDPVDLLITLTPGMREDVLRLAPLVSAWLEHLTDGGARLWTANA
jgi:hypothetical protein